MPAEHHPLQRRLRRLHKRLRQLRRLHDAGIVDGGTDNFACAQFKVCTASACVCGDVRLDCDNTGVCRNLNNDNTHCDGCNLPCDTAGGFTCKGGSCKP